MFDELQLVLSFAEHLFHFTVSPLYSDIGQCLQLAANSARHSNYFMFIGDSRIREQYFSFVQQMPGNTSYLSSLRLRKGDTHSFIDHELNLRTVCAIMIY